MNKKFTQQNNGIIIILSYPDTIVRPAYWEPSSKIWPLFGIGGKHAVQAGHAALLLIKKESSEINYFDFGRYITSYGNGRVRSKETDPELMIPLKAKFEKKELKNLNEIFLWLDKNPEKTHGDGRLVATLNNDINYNLAIKFISKLIKQKEIPYGAFVKKGSNCSRFVADTLIKSSTNKKINLQLKKAKLFTPSPIGNVIKATTSNVIYKIENQKVIHYKNRSILKEYKESFFNKFDNEPNLIGTEKPNKDIFILKKGTWLGGIGSGAWFNIESKIDSKKYIISRYDSKGNKDFEGVFFIKTNTFDINEEYEFVYPTNCLKIIILQNYQKFIFKIEN